MPKVHRSIAWRARIGRGVLLAALASALAGCSGLVAGLPVVGEPEGAPPRPATASSFPAVHDMPAPRDDKVMDPAEQAKVEQELIAARDNQAAVSSIDAFKPSKNETSRKPAGKKPEPDKK